VAELSRGAPKSNNSRQLQAVLAAMASLFDRSLPQPDKQKTAEWIREQTKQLPPAERLVVAKVIKHWLTVFATRRPDDPRIQAVLRKCDDDIARLERMLTPLDPGQPAAAGFEILDSDRAWRVKAGKSSGPPPDPKNGEPRSEAGAQPKPDSSEIAPANLIPPRKNSPADFFATGSRAPSTRENRARVRGVRP
jgi:hypothetical protein